MEYINLHVSVLDSQEFKGASPVQRATWLCLMRFLVGQEDGATIEKCREWCDRKWQQICAVTLAEVEDGCGLWQWDGDDLAVNFYPIAAEKETRAKRRGGRIGNHKRWHKPQVSESVSDTESESVSVSITKRNETEAEPNGTESAREVARPSKTEVVSWPRDNGVDPGWAAVKWENRTGAHGWERNGRMIDWRRLFQVWFQEDVRLGKFRVGGAGGSEKNAPSAASHGGQGLSPNVVAVAENQQRAKNAARLRAVQEEIECLRQAGAEVPGELKREEQELI